MDIDQEIENADIRLLHVWAGPEHVDTQKRGRAKAEIERRRRDYDKSRDDIRWERDMKLATLDGRYRANQMDHETKLAHEQMGHDEKLVSEQNKAAVSVAKATKLAAWAAGFSAVGAIIAASVAVVQFYLGK